VQSINSFKSKLFSIDSQNFDETALELFQFQYQNNLIYKSYVDHLKVNPADVKNIKEIPFLPIRFFKTQKVVTGDFPIDHIFESSGTTQLNTSKHYVEDLNFYKQVSSRIFLDNFGSIEGSIVIGLLPSYLERSNSSLVFMVNQFIKSSNRSESGFYLQNYNELNQILVALGQRNPVFLFGVTFALLEFANKYRVENENLVILETGGMKGRGRELIREELHKVLRRSFIVKKISSEYGMTELLSQAYLGEDGFFKAPPWMNVIIRDINDPFYYLKEGKTGVLNVIDLANVHSCAFIETEDLGVKSGAGFKVLGRLDNSDLRGCNLLVS
jgi:phenylacetate-coenzyme A ligase PaaK-like adenylate-forming protein